MTVPSTAVMTAILKNGQQIAVVETVAEVVVEAQGNENL
jgi:hypothetical protein